MPTTMTAAAAEADEEISIGLNEINCADDLSVTDGSTNDFGQIEYCGRNWPLIKR